MIPFQGIGRTELASIIATHLQTHEIRVVLSGGSCVSIYTNGQYVSNDLDLVNVAFAKRTTLRLAMSELGFEEEGRYFVHPDTQFIVEFPAGPLAVGDEPVRQTHEMKTKYGTFAMITATDCVKDRLAGFFHWNDRQCLEQAQLVASCCKVDLAEIERWAKHEGKHREYLAIAQRLRPSPRRR